MDSQGVHDLFKHSVATQGLNLLTRAGLQIGKVLSAVTKGLGTLEELQSVLLELDGMRAFLEDIEELSVGRIGPDGVDDGKRKLALGQVLTETLVVCILEAQKLD